MTFVRPTNTITEIYDFDIPKEYFDRACDSGVVAWDIETSGLDWFADRIATCQLYLPNGPIAIVRIQDAPPQLKSLLTNSSVKKIFHHALFDVKFMARSWEIVPQNIACTKIAAKLLDRKNMEKHSLQALLERHLHISIDKTQQTSDWFSPDLTEQQLAYAANDVLYLPELLQILEHKLKIEGLLNLTQACFDHIPTKVQLDVLGYKDIYTY